MLLCNAVALSLLSASAFAFAQDSKPGTSRDVEPQLVMSLDDLKHQGIFVSCRDDLAYVGASTFITAPNPDEPEEGVALKGWLYNICMGFKTGVCGTYKDGKLVSISGECIEEARGFCGNG